LACFLSLNTGEFSKNVVENIVTEHWPWIIDFWLTVDLISPLRDVLYPNCVIRMRKIIELIVV